MSLVWYILGLRGLWDTKIQASDETDAPSTRWMVNSYLYFKSKYKVLNMTVE